MSYEGVLEALVGILRGTAGAGAAPALAAQVIGNTAHDAAVRERVCGSGGVAALVDAVAGRGRATAAAAAALERLCRHAALARAAAAAGAVAPLLAAVGGPPGDLRRAALRTLYRLNGFEGVSVGAQISASGICQKLEP